ncbi:hypothetical protein EYF80_064696 [Liparis tanakae]|uniref:Uncharacterized protein n=1 Tax=Liparis tanakae TaxID=230148 RepID=A0A4Z2E8T7_9TELE|nr:hypothetical protein EYF80_064696 [Liparis tanakae]
MQPPKNHLEESTEAPLDVSRVTAEQLGYDLLSELVFRQEIIFCVQRHSELHAVRQHGAPLVTSGLEAMERPVITAGIYSPGC